MRGEEEWIGELRGEEKRGEEGNVRRGDERKGRRGDERRGDCREERKGEDGKRLRKRREERVKD